MKKAILHQIHPVLPVQNVLEALFFYVNKLGFEIVFANDPKTPTYAGLRRGAIEIHLEAQDKELWKVGIKTVMLRIVTQNLENLYMELEGKDVFEGSVQISKTAWGTKEFTIYDLYQNGLTFYSQI